MKRKSIWTKPQFFGVQHVHVSGCTSLLWDQFHPLTFPFRPTFLLLPLQVKDQVATPRIPQPRKWEKNKDVNVITANWVKSCKHSTISQVKKHRIQYVAYCIHLSKVQNPLTKMETMHISIAPKQAQTPQAQGEFIHVIRSYRICSVCPKNPTTSRVMSVTWTQYVAFCASEFVEGMSWDPPVISGQAKWRNKIFGWSVYTILQPGFPMDSLKYNDDNEV